LIQDFEQFASSPLHHDALELLESGVHAADPYDAVRRHLRLDGEVLNAGNFSFDLRRFRDVRLVGAGKASASMARACVEVLGPSVRGGVVVVPKEHRGGTGTVELVPGGHPLPTPEGEAAAGRIVELIGRLAEGDLVIVLISGGGSALMSLPAEGVTLDDKVAMTSELLASGASIDEVNAVRKHLSAIKGGRLAELAGDATVLSLIASDVVGDRLDTIASGPTVPDPTTYKQAAGVLDRYGVETPPAVARLLQLGMRGDVPETPEPGDSCFENVYNLLVLPMSTAVDAAARRAGELGYNVLNRGMLEGESADVAVETVKIAHDITRGRGPVSPGAAIVSGGETTVTVRGAGRGGRNQEYALAAMPLLGDDMVLAAIGTDGIDGNTDAAGALVDSGTLVHSREMSLDWRRYLDDNDSYTFFKRTGNLLFTGPTGTNVADLRVLLVGPSPQNVITPAASNPSDEE